MADLDWWLDALTSDEPLVTLREWSSGEHIVMNTAAMLLLSEEGTGASYDAWVRENLGKTTE